MPGRGTSEGQKVTLGKDAPVTREGAGTVPNESLAAESVREGGAFAQNRDAESQAFDNSKQSTSTSNKQTSTGTASHPSAGHGQHHQQKSQTSYDTEGQGAAAPGYVDAQFLARDTKGPHGKNLHEGGFEGSGPGKSIEAEPGSKDDPGRMAEQGFIGGEGSGGRGARQPGSGGGFEGEQPYGALGSETSS